jgi:predicted lipoprotein with Yx(FWY)xxD motif
VRKTTIRGAAVAVGLFLLAGCGSSNNDSSSSGGGSSSAAPSSVANAVLKTANSDLGKIVVAANGKTVYVFDKDVAGSGTSACAPGPCLDKWPVVTADSDSPAVDGVTGEVGTITRDDGTKQVTLAGLPLYYYYSDAKAGDVTGQAVGGVWWVVGPDGKKIAAAAASSTSASAMGGY